MERLQRIKICISQLDGVEVTEPLVQTGDLISGKVMIREDGIELPFEVHIGPSYPFQFHGSDTIKFVNAELLPYNHVMEDGAICLHTLHSPELEQKLQIDFGGVKQWIKKYYIQNSVDQNYEHIIVRAGKFKNAEYNFLFTEVDHSFVAGEFGHLSYSYLAQGFDDYTPIQTCLITEFKSIHGKGVCKWSDYYMRKRTGTGLFVYVDKAPVINGRFIISSWPELEQYVTPAFLKFLHDAQKTVQKNKTELPIPLFIGYRIPGAEIHWQCAAIDPYDFPTYSEKIPNTKTYEGHFYDEKVTWLQTRNCSYKYFFGRGTLTEKITNARVLIIGIGAVGSILANTLVRGGCKLVSLADYDLKEPENVCRSEYFFSSGVNSKVIDLGRSLSEVSPFVHIGPLDRFADGIKLFINKGSADLIKADLEKFDLIIDCSADNDLAFILDSLNLTNNVINLSITNKARELVCVVNPNLYKWLTEIYDSIEQDNDDLYNPTGCWSPTFKASHNDVSVLVHQAVKVINSCLALGRPPYNFYLQTTEDINVKLHRF